MTVDHYISSSAKPDHSHQILFVLFETDLVNMVLRTVVEIVQQKVLPRHIVDDALHFLAQPIASLRFLREESKF